MPSVSGNINLLHPVSGVIPVYVDSGISPWILATGFWNDSGVWDDSSVWID